MSGLARALIFTVALLVGLPSAWAGRREEAAARRQSIRQHRGSLNRAYFLYKLRTQQSADAKRGQKKRKPRLLELKRTGKRRQVKPKPKARGQGKRRRQSASKPKKKSKRQPRSVLDAAAAGLQLDEPGGQPETTPGTNITEPDARKKETKPRKKKPEAKTDNPDQLKRKPIKR